LEEGCPKGGVVGKARNTCESYQQGILFSPTTSPYGYSSSGEEEN